MIEWLTTIPGILILCGVILLIIAIILFAVGAKKSKKENVVSDSTVVDNSQNTMVNNNDIGVAPVVSEPVVSNVIETATVSVDEPVVTVSDAEPVSVVGDINMFEPQVAPVNPVQANNEEVVVNIPNTFEEPVSMDNTQVIDNAVYGGEMPSVDFTPQEEKPVTIYGGNDPLDATQTLPKMEENHVPYGGSYPEVKIVEPTIEPVVDPTPVEAAVTEMPVVEPVFTPVEPITINEPEVVSIPVEEPVVITEPEVVSIPTESVSSNENTAVVEEL